MKIQISRALDYFISIYVDKNHLLEILVWESDIILVNTEEIN